MPLFRCSVPGCGYLAQAITTFHYADAHSLTMSEVIEQYGRPVLLRENMRVANLNISAGNKFGYNEAIVPRKEFKHMKKYGYR